MVKFTIEQVRGIMDCPEQIRNMCVIAHVDHGKSTLSDSLVAAAGLIKADAMGCRALDVGDDEKERGITIKSTAISMHYHLSKELLPELADDKRDVLINLIDSPGHVDFSSEVTAALRVTDGALVVVDCVEGVCVQTETVLRQALAERIRPVVFINKVDRAVTELQLDPEELYQGFAKTLQNVNVTIAMYTDPVMGDLQVTPEKGTVAMGSGLQGWAFSVVRFARLYAKRFGVAEAKMCERLWGDNFYDAKGKRWVKSADGGTDGGSSRLRRSFCQFCVDPVYQIFEAVSSNNAEKLDKILGSLGIALSVEERAQAPKKVVQSIMMKFLPAADTLLEMIVTHLPSPKTAQAYRAGMLYTGEATDKYYAGMAGCDPNGPLMLYVSKMVPTRDRKRLFAFGRVFSGTVRTGQKVRIMGNNYVAGSKTDLYEDKAIQRTVLMMGKTQEFVDSVPCGNVVALVGVDKYVVKNATITEDAERGAHPLKDMKYSVSPVVRVAVEAKNAADLPKLIEGLKLLSKVDQLVQCTTAESGEHIIAGAGELHLEICLRELQNDFMDGAAIKVSDPVVSYRETVSAPSSVVCLSKSLNKHNRVFARGAPLGEACAADMDVGGVCGVDVDAKVRERHLADRHGWDVHDARKIWCFGPDGRGPNVLVDATRGVQNLREVQDSFVAAWQWAAKEGVLCDEVERGVRVNIEDVVLHTDPAHRNQRQMMPMARRAYHACALTGSPRLVEPVFLVDIQTVEAGLGGVYSVITRRRGEIAGAEQRPGTPIFNVRGYVPVAESFGLTAELRAATSGQAFPQCVFDHWQHYPGDPLDGTSAAGTRVREVRKRKGLTPDVPTLDNFLDKL